jgi:hypothetical protein
MQSPFQDIGPPFASPTFFQVTTEPDTGPVSHPSSSSGGLGGVVLERDQVLTSIPEVDGEIVPFDDEHHSTLPATDDKPASVQEESVTLISKYDDVVKDRKKGFIRSFLMCGLGIWLHTEKCYLRCPRCLEPSLSRALAV